MPSASHSSRLTPELPLPAVAGRPQPSPAAPFSLGACLLSSLAGVFRGGHDILVRSRLLLLDTVTMQVTARSSEELPVDIVLASVG